MAGTLRLIVVYPSGLAPCSVWNYWFVHFRFADVCSLAIFTPPMKVAKFNGSCFRRFLPLKSTVFKFLPRLNFVPFSNPWHTVRSISGVQRNNGFERHLEIKQVCCLNLKDPICTDHWCFHEPEVVGPRRSHLSGLFCQWQRCSAKKKKQCECDQWGIQCCWV